MGKSIGASKMLCRLGGLFIFKALRIQGSGASKGDLDYGVSVRACARHLKCTEARNVSDCNPKLYNKTNIHRSIYTIHKRNLKLLNLSDV